MAMNRSYQYCLYPNKPQTKSLNQILELHRELYNAALEERRAAWRRCRVSLNYFDQANQLKELRTIRADLAALNYSSCQQTLRRVNKAFDGFFRRIQSGQTPGYPRFQSRARFNSVAFVWRWRDAFHESSAGSKCRQDQSQVASPDSSGR